MLAFAILTELLPYENSHFMCKQDKVDQLRKSLQAKKEAEQAAAKSGQKVEVEQNSEELSQLKSDIESLQKKLNEAQEKAKAAEGDYLRAHAEMQNNQRRLNKEKQDFIKYGNENLLKELLPILDSLEKALEAAGDQEKHLKEGVGLVHKQFLSALEKFGLQVLNPKGEVFDPHFHEAVSQVKTDAQASGTVWEVLRTGYLLHDRVLRAAMVSVVA